MDRQERLDGRAQKTKMDRTSADNHVCPWWMGYLLCCPLRRLLENPEKILGPHVHPGMKVVEPGCGMGFFSLARSWLAGYVVTIFVPVEALSFVVLSFAAEFTSGFAAAGALLDAGILTTKQTVIALLAGNIIAFPIRALRHQLPRYIGIFSPKMGTQLLLMGQGFRVLSLMIVGYLYYCLG